LRISTFNPQGPCNDPQGSCNDPEAKPQLVHGLLVNVVNKSVWNPDGALTGRSADQESKMFLRQAQLAKGEHVLRIVDYVDKIVSTTEDRTLSEFGAIKRVVEEAQNRKCYFGTVGQSEH